ncbi:hypothetical protein CAPTEDRAFT_219593 [Capitella teleta]|uniref:G-protein coupled receptors family 3 profile domain-containing protein n=1 Tax=Capitella teleta TaxID=283909 RepID=R7ULK0_CAPTE|nr:hypothetical protein CAPTEDRAFT_219593 [Capitella teleta]|eukprot:ELU04152.1 hypothetical protein CAPTEDRAFT_219593 [Capitella teleta]
MRNSIWLEFFGEIYPTCLLIGLTMFIGGLMVKSWAIFSFYKWNTSKKASINEEWKPNVWIWLLILIMGVCVVVWTVTFKSSLHYVEQEDGLAIYTCKWTNTFEWLTATMVWHGLLLIVTFVAIFANCCVGSEARKQSGATSLVTINTLAVAMAGCVLYFLTESSATIAYGIYGALAVWMCFFGNMIIFLYKAASVCCCTKREAGEDFVGDEHYDTIKSDNSDIVGQTNQTFTNNGYEPSNSTENFNY